MSLNDRMNALRRADAKQKREARLSAPPTCPSKGETALRRDEGNRPFTVTDVQPQGDGTLKVILTSQLHASDVREDVCAPNDPSDFRSRWDRPGTTTTAWPTNPIEDFKDRHGL